MLHSNGRGRIQSGSGERSDLIGASGATRINAGGRSRRSGAWGLLLSSAFAGCAGSTTTSIRDEADDARARGFRYYESSPYLLVYSDGKAGLTTRLIYLPDLTKKRSVRPYQFLARNATKLTFANGVLTSAEMKGEATVVPKALIEAAKGAASQAFKAFAASGEGRAPPPYLYKVVFDEQGARLEGGPGMLGGVPQEISIVPDGGGGR
jgi:hypothetical protein